MQGTKREGRKMLKNITICISEFYNQKIEEMQEQGLIASRSDAIRTAIGLRIKAELNFLIENGFSIDIKEFLEYNLRERITEYLFNVFIPKIWVSPEGKQNLKIITVNIPVPYIEIIDLLEEKNVEASRSEYIRVAIRDFVQKSIKTDS